MLGKIKGRRRRGQQRIRRLDGITEINGLEFEQAPENGEGQGSLACCSPWGGKESDMTEQLKNNTEKCNNVRHIQEGASLFFFEVLRIVNTILSKNFSFKRKQRCLNVYQFSI